MQYAELVDLVRPAILVKHAQIEQIVHNQRDGLMHLDTPETDVTLLNTLFDLIFGEPWQPRHTGIHNVDHMHQHQ